MKRIIGCLLLLLLATLAQAGLADQEVEARTGFYVRGLGGPRWFSALSDKDRGARGNQDGFAEFTLGLQTPSMVGVELGGGGEAALGDFFVGPTLRIPAMLWGDRPWIHAFGLRYDFLSNNSRGVSNGYYSSPSVGDSGSYGNGWTASYGLERMMGRYLSLGLQFSYQSAVIDQKTSSYNYNNGYYTYTTTSRQLDLTGPRLALTLAFWPKPPYLTTADRERIARREEQRRANLARRAALRRERYRIYDSGIETLAAPALESPFANAQEALDLGNRQLKAKQYKAATNAFTIAARMDPASKQAWRLLGRSQYIQGKHSAALQAYSRALELEPDDQKLQGFVEKLRAEMVNDAP